MVIPGHNLGNSQVSVNRTIGPTLVFSSIDTESINFDHHLRCGGWLNFKFSQEASIRAHAHPPHLPDLHKSKQKMCIYFF